MSVSAMRWLRKHNKKMLAGIVFVLMVAFGLPTTFFYVGGGRERGREALGHYVDGKGKRRAILGEEVLAAQSELRAVGLLVGPNANGLVYGAARFAGISPDLTGQVNLLLLHQEGLGGGEARQREAREALRRMIGEPEVAPDATARERLWAAVDDLTSVDGQRAALYYILLKEEAKGAGITASAAQVQALEELALQYWPSLGDLVRYSGVGTRARLKEAIGNYLAILRYAAATVHVVSMSQGELEHRVRKDLEERYVSGTYVEFSEGAFRGEASAPTAEQVRELFEKYKGTAPGAATAENPRGLGYRLPDRVQVEYMRADVARAMAAVEEEFDKLGVLEQEKKREEEWRKDREEYVGLVRRQVQATAEEQAAPATAAELREGRLMWEGQKAWQRRVARERAEQVLTRAADLARQKRSTALAARQGGREGWADYAELAGQASTEAVVVAYGRTPYLSAEGLRKYEGLGGARDTRAASGGSDLATALFECAALRQRPATRLDERPVELYEDLGPLLASGGGAEGYVYVVRLAGVDAAREAASPADDGTGGAGPAEGQEEASSQLYQKVEQDGQRLQGYEIAKQKAKRFAEQAAGSDWKTAFEEYNGPVSGDPNRAMRHKLYEATLEERRAQMGRLEGVIRESLRNGARENPEMAEYARGQLATERGRIEAAARLARQRLAEGGEGPRGPAVLEMDNRLSVLVFKDLRLIEAGEEDYLRRRPLAAQQLMEEEQQWSVLLHLAPGNIEKRMGYESRAGEAGGG